MKGVSYHSLVGAMLYTDQNHRGVLGIMPFLRVCGLIGAEHGANGQVWDDAHYDQGDCPYDAPPQKLLVSFSSSLSVPLQTNAFSTTMQYLAFDVSKAKLDAVLTNLRTKTEYFSIENDLKAIEGWLGGMKLPKKLVMGCEATGGYHLTLAKICREKGFVFKVINPILTKQFTRATVRKKKTDQSDSLIIAKLLAQGEGSLFTWDPKIEAAKRANRLQVLVGRHEVALRLCQADRPDPHLANIIVCMRKTMAIREKELKAEHRDNADLAILESIPGVGWKSAFAIWSEIGSIEKFASAKQLIAYAGLDPRIRQSGHTLNSQGKLTKRGSPYLRRSLFIAANCARQYDAELKTYYWKKRGEGKKHTVAVCATARKLIARIHAVWSRRTPYIALSS